MSANGVNAGAAGRFVAASFSWRSAAARLRLYGGSSRPRNAPALCALSVLFAAACGRDLALPPAATAPVVATFAPAEAFAGQDLVIAGQAFDPEPARNVVHFASAAVPADSLDATGALVVRVPVDAGSGPLSVTTVAGTGNASPAPFTYLGLGHLRHGQLSATLSALHHAPGAVALAGDLWIASSLFRTVQSRLGKLVHLDHRPVALTSDGSALYAGTDDVTTHELVRIDPAAAVTTGPVRSLAWPLRALAVARDATGPVVFAAGDDGTVSYLRSFRGDATLAPALPERTLPAFHVLNLAATASGARVVLVAQQQNAAGAIVTGALVVDTTQPSLVPAWIVAPGAAVPTGALAIAGTTAYVGLDDGTVLSLALQGTPAWTGAPLDTLSRTPVGALAVFNSGKSLVAAKPAEATIVALTPASGALLWGVPVRGRPGVLAADDAAGAVYASDETSNFVDAVDSVKGAFQNRVSFEAGLGSPDGSACGVAYDALNVENGKRVPRFLVVARGARAVLNISAFSLDLRKPLSLVRGSTSLATCVGVAPDGTVWVVHQRELGRLDVAAKKEVIVVKDLPVPPVGIAFTADSRVILRFPNFAAALAPDGTTLGGVNFDGNLDLLTLSGGNVVAAWSTAGAKPAVAHVAQWSLDGFIAGRDPLARFDDASPNAGYAGAVALPDRTLVFFDSSPQLSGKGSAFPLDGALRAGVEEAAPVKALGPILPSPDGRYFLWTRRKASDLVLHETRAVAGSSIVNVEDLQLSSALQGAAFDGTGEKLVVPVAAGDSMQVFE